MIDDDAARYVPPSPTALISQVAEKCGATREAVDAAMRDVGIVLRSPLPVSRRIQVQRLRLAGVKHTGERFSFEQRLGPGVWAIAHERNSAGKTSLLECMVWPLRGEPRDLPPDVRSWLRAVVLDAAVGDRFLRILIEQDPDDVRDVTVKVLQAASSENLLTDADDELTTVMTGTGAADVESVIGELILDSLSLEPTAIWNARGGQDGEGATQRHGWASYFGACYLNPGGDKLLFGDVSQSPSLSARLLELFVAIPYASVSTHLKAVGKRQAKEDRQNRQRIDQDLAARATDRDTWIRELETVNTQLTVAQREVGDAVLAELTAADDTLTLLRTARQNLTLAEDTLHEIRAARIAADQHVLDVEESWQARRVLGLLNPICCPRCEMPIDSGRRTKEKDHSSCSVCTRPLPEADAELAETVIADLRSKTAEASALEVDAAAEFEKTTQAVRGAAAAYDQASARLEAARVSTGYQQVRDLELHAARLHGQLDATGSQHVPRPSSTAGPDQMIHELSTLIDASVKQATDEVFPLLDQQIVSLARSFGVEHLDSVRLRRNGQVNAVKAGQSTPFGNFSRGDRLRMRIATAIAMLRIGAKHGMRPHPGLLLIDAVGSEEVTTEPGRALITELNQLAEELPDLQVILTTANPDLVDGVLPADRIITANEDHLF